MTKRTPRNKRIVERPIFDEVFWDMTPCRLEDSDRRRLLSSCSGSKQPKKSVETLKMVKENTTETQRFTNRNGVISQKTPKLEPVVNELVTNEVHWCT